MPKQSKRYRSLAERTSDALLPLDKAVELLKTFNTTKFDQTVEIAVRLGIDAKQADQLVRGSIVLPHGIGKNQRVVVFAKGDLAAAAQAAGADEVGQEDLAKRIREGWTDFDACIASPDMMGVVGPLGKVLGPRGLMPSPRAGTVTNDVARVVQEYKAGKVEFRNDNSGIVHAMVGKLSFDAAKLEENIQAFINHIQSLKP
ncbi:MAG: 50S ribosomal protein L1, partial [Planctomycetales bacterium]|nr:50S ribosomal protein L1 [Planctomycetales bacterium]